MTTLQRLTITLPADVLAHARELAGGNLSKFISEALSEHIEELRLRQLREDLIAAAIAKAEEDLETAEAFRFAEEEVVARYIPPYFESDNQGTPAPSDAVSHVQDQ